MAKVIAYGSDRVKTNPADWYWREDVMKVEREHIFMKHWQLFSRSASFEKPGDYVADTVAGIPVIVVMDQAGFALYFSRAAIPWPRDDFAATQDQLPAGNGFFRHIGIYAYRVKLLNDFVRWAPSPIEQRESLEQLRAMWYGARIHVANADEAVPGGVDTDDDLQRLREHLSGVSDEK